MEEREEVKEMLQWQNDKIEELETKIEEDEPYANYGKVVSVSKGSITIQNFGSILSTDMPRLKTLDEDDSEVEYKTGANTIYK